MRQAGQIVLFRFPQTDLEEGELRPAVVEGEILLGAVGQIASERLQRLKGRLADWLVRL
jgi:hypothetical protein